MPEMDISGVNFIDAKVQPLDDEARYNKFLIEFETGEGKNNRTGCNVAYCGL
jgi:hypothetical protein